jgi:hypothetical protein
MRKLNTLTISKSLQINRDAEIFSCLATHVFWRCLGLGFAKIGEGGALRCGDHSGVVAGVGSVAFASAWPRHRRHRHDRAGPR